MERTEFTTELEKRLSEKRKFIQVLAGPRQVGKTTIINQVLERYKNEFISESADNISSSQVFIEQIWNTARLKLKSGKSEILIVIDEIQKIPNLKKKFAQKNA